MDYQTLPGWANIKNKLKTSAPVREVLVFIGIAALFYLVYEVVYVQVLEPSQKFDSWLNWEIAQEAAALFRFLGRESTVVVVAPWPALIMLDNRMAVNVGTPCNGVPMMYMFLGFVVAHAGPWRRKLWFIPVGLLLIHGSNILRIMALAEAVLYHPEIYEFNHKYAYTIVVYSLIIGLFALWHLRLSNPAWPVWPKRVTKS